jgi:hypothetical protein
VQRKCPCHVAARFGKSRPENSWKTVGEVGEPCDMRSLRIHASRHTADVLAIYSARARKRALVYIPSLRAAGVKQVLMGRPLRGAHVEKLILTNRDLLLVDRRTIWSQNNSPAH